MGKNEVAIGRKEFFRLRFWFHKLSSTARFAVYRPTSRDAIAKMLSGAAASSSGLDDPEEQSLTCPT